MSNFQQHSGHKASSCQDCELQVVIMIRSSNKTSMKKSEICNKMLRQFQKVTLFLAYQKKLLYNEVIPVIIVAADVTTYIT
jgi:hypothetical protein